jgi:hypothetical protein
LNLVGWVERSETQQFTARRGCWVSARAALGLDPTYVDGQHLTAMLDGFLSRRQLNLRLRERVERYIDLG